MTQHRQDSDYGLPFWPTYRRFVWFCLALFGPIAAVLVVLIAVNPVEGMQRLREVGYGLAIFLPLIVPTIIWKNRTSGDSA